MQKNWFLSLYTPVSSGPGTDYPIFSELPKLHWTRAQLVAKQGAEPTRALVPRT